MKSIEIKSSIRQKIAKVDSKSLRKNIKNAYLIPNAVHSDHCPVGLKLRI